MTGAAQQLGQQAELAPGQVQRLLAQAGALGGGVHGEQDRRAALGFGAPGRGVFDPEGILNPGRVVRYPENVWQDPKEAWG